MSELSGNQVILRLDDDDWENIRNSMKQEYNSFRLHPGNIEQCKEELGFTQTTEDIELLDFFGHDSYWHTQILLEFCNESAKTMFLLKYQEYIRTPVFKPSQDDQQEAAPDQANMPAQLTQSE